MQFKNKNPVLFTIVIPVVLSVLMLYQYKKGIRNAADIGLGKATSTFTPFIDNYPVHITNPSLANLMKEGWIKRGNKNVYLWIGNSQLHGINEYAPGQTNCIGFLFDQLKPLNEEVLGVSLPNGNLQEFFMEVIYYSKLIPPKGIILPLFFDDMREDGIRDLLKLNAIIDSIRPQQDYFSSLKNIASLEVSKSKEAVNDFNGIRETTQDISERYLSRWFESNWSIWRSRPDIRGNLFNDLYNIRNKLFGINASTTREMIPGRYKNNFTAYCGIVKYCKTNNIPLLIYIPPIRHDVPIPYKMTDYISFKKNVEDISKASPATFLNLENLVPGQYWGYLKPGNMFDETSGLDFMHFKQKGHQLIADTIFVTLKGKREL